jgi:hypothetical protein
MRPPPTPPPPPPPPPLPSPPSVRMRTRTRNRAGGDLRLFGRLLLRLFGRLLGHHLFLGLQNQNELQNYEALRGPTPTQF